MPVCLVILTLADPEENIWIHIFHASRKKPKRLGQNLNSNLTIQFAVLKRISLVAYLISYTLNSINKFIAVNITHISQQIR